jgi:hypothetical protein
LLGAPVPAPAHPYTAPTAPPPPPPARTFSISQQPRRFL